LLPVSAIRNSPERVLATQVAAPRAPAVTARTEAGETPEIPAQGCAVGDGRVAGCGDADANAIGGRGRALVDGLEVIVPEVLYRTSQPLVQPPVPPQSALAVPFPTQGNPALW
jgi:hypothetical protein